MQTRARTVAILVFPEVELLDFAAPLQVFTVAGRRWNFRPFKVQVCAPTEGVIPTRNQLRIEAPIPLARAVSSEVLLIPGGYGARLLCDDDRVVAELARVGSEAELVGAVGWGVALLTRTGLTRGARVAAPPEVAEVARAAPHPISTEVQSGIARDGRVLTASGSAHALDLGLTIVEVLCGAKLASLVRADLGSSQDRIEITY